MYLVRMLPIVFGTHTIIIMMLYIAIVVSINKIPVAKAISFSLISIIIISISEWINFFVLDKVLKVDMKAVHNNVLIKTIYFMPSLMLFGCGVLSFCILYTRIKKRI